MRGSASRLSLDSGLHLPGFNSQCYLVTSFAILAPSSWFTFLVSNMGMIIAATPGGGCEGLHERAHLGCVEPCLARFEHSVNVSAGLLFVPVARAIRLQVWGQMEG